MRITTIYEGTSEIMEWTIARERWQLHLKSRGAYYNDWADRLERSIGPPRAGKRRRRDRSSPAPALAVILERCRLDRLTRSQHVLFRLGELIACAETAAVFAERVVQRPTEAILDTPTPGHEPHLCARPRSRSPATACTGLSAPGRAIRLAASLNLPAIYQPKAGLLADMDFVAGKLNEAFPAA